MYVHVLEEGYFTMKIRVTTHSYALQKLGIIPNLGVKGYGSRTTISRPTTPAKTLLLLKMRVETLILTLVRNCV